jgi:hypothetical protein
MMELLPTPSSLPLRAAGRRSSLEGSGGSGDVRNSLLYQCSGGGGSGDFRNSVHTASRRESLSRRESEEWPTLSSGDVRNSTGQLPQQHSQHSSSRRDPREEDASNFSRCESEEWPALGGGAHSATASEEELVEEWRRYKQLTEQVEQELSLRQSARCVAPNHRNQFDWKMGRVANGRHALCFKGAGVGEVEMTPWSRCAVWSAMAPRFPSPSRARVRVKVGVSSRCSHYLALSG